MHNAPSSRETAAYDAREIAASLHFTEVGKRHIADYRGMMIVTVDFQQYYACDEWEQFTNSNSVPTIIRRIDAMKAGAPGVTA